MSEPEVSPPGWHKPVPLPRGQPSPYAAASTARCGSSSPPSIPPDRPAEADGVPIRSTTGAGPCAVTDDDIKAAAEKLEAFEGMLNAAERRVIGWVLHPRGDSATRNRHLFWQVFRGSLWPP